MKKIGIIGISGYSGGEVLKILLKHKDVRVTYVSAHNTVGNVVDIWPDLKGQTKLVCKKFDLNEAIKNADLFFLAVPHTTSMMIVPQLLNANKQVIDLSGDYRLKNAALYNKWYKTPHTDPANLRKAVYGLSELYRENIKKASLVANPGCYPTAAILGLAPLVSIQTDNIASIYIDAKSGVSGAGKKADIALNFCEVNENFKAYKALNHQHNPEIDLYLSKIANTNISTEFVPHLLPVNRGILETIYVRLNKKITLSHLHTVYKRFYKVEPFVRVLNSGLQPELKHVVHTNFCDIGLTMNKSKDLVVITSVIDNLVKGAAGQAVQNMNIMCNFDETEGLL